MKAAAIEFQNVSKRYGEVAAVQEVSFAIAAGTLVTLLGPSGCGKTTTLRMIAGLELPTAGTIRIGGADVTRVPAAQRDVSMVFQSYALFPHMTVLENWLRLTVRDSRSLRGKGAGGAGTAGWTGLMSPASELGAAAAGGRRPRAGARARGVARTSRCQSDARLFGRCARKPRAAAAIAADRRPRDA
jgi:iron(III) transport system ATP-binding protein